MSLHPNYIQLRETFIKHTKKVLKRKITTNVEKHKEYVKDITESFNAIITFLKEAKLSESQSALYSVEISNLRTKLTRCWGKLNITAELPASRLQKLELNELYDSIIVEDDSNNSEISENSSSDSETENMASTDMDCIRAFGNTINKNYEGDPLALDAFINSIELLKLACPAGKENLLLQFIKTRLAGKARECVPTEVASLDEITQKLRTTIKPEGSKVISGRMLALKLDQKRVQDYSKQAEDLADAFQRSLVVEGIPHAKAKEMTVDKTIEMCRASAKSDMVRSVLAAASFKEPNEVIAKLIVESSNDKNEKQVFAYQKYQNNKFGNNRNEHGYRRYNNNKYNNSNHSRGRGRGKHNGRGRGGYQNGQNYNQRHGQNNGNSGGRYNVRYTEGTQPQQMSLGFQNTPDHQRSD